jgi:hypothetical protein
LGSKTRAKECSNLLRCRQRIFKNEQLESTRLSNIYVRIDDSIHTYRSKLVDRWVIFLVLVRFVLLYVNAFGLGLSDESIAFSRVVSHLVFDPNFVRRTVCLDDE